MFHLVYGDLEFTLPLPFEADVEGRLVGILERVSQPLDPDDRSKIEFTQRMVAVITALVDGNVVPPTEKQTQYALAIARTLSLQISPEVLQYRDAMTAFINQHAPEYRRRKSS